MYIFIGEAKMKAEEIDELIVKRAMEVYWELRELLKEKHPELLPLYDARFEYMDPHYPPVMRLHNAYEILRAWHQLKHTQ
jgi:hypothetical protein